MPRALITGAAGQDGWYLSRLLLDDGYDVVGMERGTTTTAALPPGVQGVTGDLLDAASLRRVLEEARPDEIYNLAGLSSVAQSWQEPERAVEVNGVGVVRLLQAVRQVVPGARVVQAGSAEIFGSAPAPQDETTAVQPTTPYGAAKALAHDVVHVYRGAGLLASNAILYNHESPRRPLQFVTRKITATVARIALGSDETLALGNLAARRDWGHARDYCRALLLIGRYPSAEDFVVATGRGRSVADFAAAAFAHVGIEDWQRHVRVDAAFSRPTDPGELRGDASRARRLLGWTPQVTFEELVGEMVDADLRALRERTGEVLSP